MATTSSSLSATGSVTLDLKGDNRAIFGISGTYGTVTAVIEGTADGSVWQQLAAVRLIDQVRETTTLSPGDNTTRAWVVEADAFKTVRFRVTAIASGTVSVRGDSFLGQGPVANSVNSLSQTLETLTFSGATGANEIRLTDNLADALSVKISGGADFLIADTTNSNEKLTILSATTQKLGFFGTTPVVQQATTGTATGFTAGSGTAVNDDSTFTGGSGSKAYRISDLVLALKNYGILAAS